MFSSHKGCSSNEYFIQELEKIWNSRLIWDLDQTYFGSKGNSFMKFINKSLQSFDKQEVCVHTFRLKITRNCPELNCLINQSFLSRNLREPNLTGCRYKNLYGFSFKTLITLVLFGFNLTSCENIDLPCLRSLDLENMVVNTTVIQKFITGSPLLHYFRLFECKGLVSLEISNNLDNKIITLSIKRCPGLCKVEIWAPCLECFMYSDDMPSSEIKLMACEETLKKLAIERTNLTNEWLQSQFVDLLVFKFWTWTI